MRDEVCTRLKRTLQECVVRNVVAMEAVAMEAPVDYDMAVLAEILVLERVCLL